MKKFLGLVVFLGLSHVYAQHAQLELEMQMCSQRNPYLWDQYFTLSKRHISDTVRLYGGGGTNHQWQKVVIVRAPVRLLVVSSGSYDSTGALRVSPAYYDSLPFDTSISFRGSSKCISWFLDQLGVTVDITAEKTVDYIEGDTITLDSAQAYLLKYFAFNAPWGHPTLVLLESPTGIEEGLYQEKNIRFGPNPFSNLIRFETDKPIEIFDVSGKLIRRLDKEKVWNGRDENGKEVPVGIYFCRFKSGLKQTQAKIVKLK